MHVHFVECVETFLVYFKNCAQYVFIVGAG